MSSGKTLQKANLSGQQPPTPSFAKRKKAQEKADIRSPTDNMISPCTRKLMRKVSKDEQTLPQAPFFTVEDKENAPS